jgi:molybdate transport system ATP-binding protein
LLIQALLGHTPPLKGEIRGPFPSSNNLANAHAPSVATVSAHTQRDLAVQESSFYQLRWHSGLEQGPRTVAEYLSQDSVEGRNPFEVAPLRRNRQSFLRRRRHLVDRLGLQPLFRRRLLHLSNGEMRKTLLAHNVLAAPSLLILEDPYSGLDVATRQELRQVIAELIRTGFPILVATHRAEELPETTTHLLLVDNYRIRAQGPKRPMLQLWRQQAHAGRNQPDTVRRKPRPRAVAHPGTRSEPLIELHHVSVDGARKRILNDISWTVYQGERWVLQGPNGAGKSTLLNLIQGDHPQAYAVDIRLFGRRTDSTRSLWLARERIGWMSPELHQHYPGGWTALEVVCSGFFNSIGLHQPCPPRKRAIARRWLARIGLTDQVSTPFGELALGRQRLVMLARAAVKSPELLILDEPCQGLDVDQRRVLLDTVDHAVADSGATLIFVTHHPREIPGCITHLLRLRAGRVRDAGAVRQGRPHWAGATR